MFRTACAVALLVVSLQSGSRSPAPPLSVDHLRTEYKDNPIGIDVRRPRLSWRLAARDRGVVQRAYQIRVATSVPALATRPLWDSQKVASDASIHRPYDGPALETGRRYFWQVRVWDGHDRVSPWSDAAFWEMGLLAPDDWKAAWITPDGRDDPKQSQPCPMMRHAFRVDGDVASARAYVSSLGLYEMEINGRRVGDAVFTPGWTSYDTRVQYQTYDVTDLLQRGDNAVGAVLGDGWYRGNLAWNGNRNTWGDRLALIAQIRITYRDGRTGLVATDSTWKTATGPIRLSDIYNGETYDARLEKAGWTRAGFDDSDWTAVRVLDHSKAVLIAPAGPPVRRIQELKPIAILHTPGGDTVFDLGQNMVGWVRLKVSGPAGTTVTMRHAEALDKAGNFYTANLRKAAQTVTYILRGGGEETYEPRFTFQGFRYVAVTGLPSAPSLGTLTGIVVHSDMRQAGTFETSNPLINQLQHNIQWGQKGNFIDVPTDCPQRDERLGWTGDAQVFARTAAFNADVAGFFTKWLADVAADQKASGSVPHVIPDVLTHKEKEGGGATGWADVSVIVPWTVYLVYGDTRVLENQYESMTKWIGFMRDHADPEFVWRKGTHFGDWLAFATNRADYPGATTDKDLIATAFFAYSTGLVARTASILGKTRDAEAYTALRRKIEQGFVREFLSPGGRLTSNTQTAYVLALAFDLLPGPMRAQAADRLVANVRSFNNHLTTGFLGTPYICHTLTATGHLDVAYALLNQQTYPSWLYPVKSGATTIWERWDGVKPDGSFQDPGMNSLNHYAYGAIGAWLYSVVAGIDVDPAEPGYKHVLIRPQPGGGLTHATATYDSMYGEIRSAWKIEGNDLTLDVTVPPNTHATIALPNARADRVTESGSPLAGAAGISDVRQDGSSVVLSAGSGTYVFKYPR